MILVVRHNQARVTLGCGVKRPVVFEYGGFMFEMSAAEARQIADWLHDSADKADHPKEQTDE